MADNTGVKYRQEHDSLGRVSIPEDAYYGAQTARARKNFIESGLKPPSEFIYALALIKRFAAAVNKSLDYLEPESAEAIITSATEVMEGKFEREFVVDLFQTGSGTSTNMNMNEVIASRANEILSGKRGGKAPVHPNDHVNLGQSSNDVIPTAIHVAGLTAIKNNLIPSLKHLQKALQEKADAFKKIQKIGRTHLQDAVPISLGDEFSGYGRQAVLSLKRIETASDNLKELALGGTAVGNGLNTHPAFARNVIAHLAVHLQIDFREAQNHFEAQSSKDAIVEMSGALRTVAGSLIKIANDIRWLASGPRCGLGEIALPALQPGSSIMPGKVNPIIPESILQIAYQVMGNDTTIMMAGQGGNFELNVAIPLMAHNLLQSIHLLAAGCRNFADNCIKGITADEEKCAALVDKSLALVTYLVPEIGYDKAAALAKKAYETGKSIGEIVVDEGVISAEEWEELILQRH